MPYIYLRVGTDRYLRAKQDDIRNPVVDSEEVSGDEVIRDLKQRLQNATDALMALHEDEKLKAWLVANDIKALAQIRSALVKGGRDMGEIYGIIVPEEGSLPEEPEEA